MIFYLSGEIKTYITGLKQIAPLTSEINQPKINKFEFLGLSYYVSPYWLNLNPFPLSYNIIAYVSNVKTFFLTDEKFEQIKQDPRISV